MSKMFVPSRVYKPFAYSKAVDLTVEHERMHWHEGEIDLSDDLSDWKLGRLTLVEKDFVTQILRMFTQSDVNVGGFYYDNLIPLFRNNEIRNMLGSFATREGTHQRAYALLNDTLGLPEGDYAAFLDYKEMADKDEFMRDTMIGKSDTTIPLSLAKATFNEGVSLFASFVMLLNFQRRGLMKGMGKVVEWSVKDETKHVEGVAWLFRQLCAERPDVVTDEFKAVIYQMARDCVALEDAFIDLAFRMGPVDGITPQEIKSYIRFIADRRLVTLGLKENWKIPQNPLPWVDILLNAPDHTNFFENKVAEYEVGSLEGEWIYQPAEFRIYGKSGCDWCVRAKEKLSNAAYAFDYVDLSDDATRWAFFDERGIAPRTVPQIYRLVDGREQHVGGYQDLNTLLT